MKNIFAFILVLCVAAGVQAKPVSGAHSDWKLQAGVPSTVVDNLRFTPSIDLNKEDAFGNTPVFAAARKGDVRFLAWLEKVAPNGEYLIRTGKDGNNVLHVARDLKTFNALLGSIRHFYPQDCQRIVQFLLEQKNDLKETPLRAQLNYGKADIFIKYFPSTRLYARMNRVQSKLSQGGLVAAVAEDEKKAVLEVSKDLSGLTLPQAVRRSAARPGMAAVVQFFEQEFPSL